MQHVLMGRRDVAARSVIVSAEVSGDTAAFRGAKQKRKIDLATMIDDRLCGFDHHLKLQTAFSKTGLLLELCEECCECRHLFRNSDLWQGHYEVIGQAAVIEFDQTRDKNIQRAEAALSQFFVERLDANSDERRTCA